MTDYASCLAPRQLQCVRVLLVWHDAGAGAKLVGELDRVELGGRPEDPLLRPATQVDGDERQTKDELRGEIAIAGRVEAVPGHLGEAEFIRHRVAVDRQ